MVLSVCPNPSVDCTVEVETLKVGSTNRIDNKVITYSGKALNVAIGVARLKGDSFATGFLYNGNGAMFVHVLDDEGVKNTFVWNDGNARTNYKVVDNKSMLTELNDKGDLVTEEKQEELISIVKELSKQAKVVVMSGSLPTGVPEDYYLRLASVLPEGVKAIVDATGDRLRYALKAHPYFVKPNLAELQELNGETYAGTNDILRGCRKLIDGGAENVLLSLGRKGAILTDGSSAWYCKSANVAVNSTVGAGDSMVAAVARFTEEGAGKAELLRTAVAAGTASVTTPGTNLFYYEKFREIYEKISVEKIPC